jgi:magnesium transporter
MGSNDTEFDTKLSEKRRKLSSCCRAQTLIEAPSSKEASVKIIAYQEDSFLDRKFDTFSEIDEIRCSCNIIWIDVEGPLDDQQIEHLSNSLKIDSPAFVDALKPKERAQLDTFGANMLLTLHALRPEAEIKVEQLSILVSGNAIVTFHNNAISHIDSIRRDLREKHSLIYSGGRQYLVQRLVDEAVDTFPPILSIHSEELECLEDAILERPEKETIQEVHAARKELLVLKRLILPLRDALRRLVRDSPYLTKDEGNVFSRETYEHASDTLVMVEYYITVTADLMALHMSSLSNRMNEVMTVLAIVAAVFLPPSLIAGIYGMNFFEHSSPWNMPEVNWDFGYPFAIALMILIAVFSLVIFWKNGWLRVLVQSPRRQSR